MPAPGPNQDIFPQSDEQFVAWLLNFANNWDEAVYNAIDPTAAILMGLYNTMAARLAAATNPITRTPVTIANKDHQKTLCKPPFRWAARSALAAYRAGSAQPGQIAILGLRVPPLVQTPILAPSDSPILAFNSSTPGQLHYRLTQSVNGSPVSTRAYPYGITGVLLKETWGTSERTQTIKRVIIATSTAGIPKGTIVKADACYLTARGLQGPLSPPTTGVVS